MAVDKETTVEYNIWIEDDKEKLKQAKNLYLKEYNDDTEIKHFVYNDSVVVDEYYFEDGMIHINFNNSKDGQMSSIYIPLSDEVLIDILQYSVKKLSKLKSALESLK